MLWPWVGLSAVDTTVASPDLQGLEAFLFDPGFRIEAEPPRDPERERVSTQIIAALYPGAEPAADPDPPRPKDPARAFAALEEHTEAFRRTLAGHHRDVAAAARDSYRDLVAAWNPLEDGEPVLRGEPTRACPEGEPITMADLLAR